MKLNHLFQRTSKIDLFSLGEKRLAQLKAEGRYSCYRNTRATLQKLAAFVGGKPLPLGKVTPELMESFRDYLINTVGNSHNTVAENIKILSRFFDEAGVRKNPCKGAALTRIQRPRSYLQEEELARMMALRLPKGGEMDVARDIFFTECRTGLRISDLLQLRWCDFDGQYIRLKMQKTRRPVEIPVSASVQKTLEKYHDLFSRPNSRIFPILDRVKDRTDEFSPLRRLIYGTSHVNMLIKRVASRAGITKRVSTHVARHTFATMLISKGASIYDVKELLGHQDVKVTQVYAHLLDGRKRELVELLEGGVRVI